MQALLILDRRQPAAGEIALDAVADGAAVAHVIVRGHNIAVGGQEVREIIIAGNMLRDAVDELHNGFGLRIRLPDGAVQAATAAGIDKKFFHERFSFQ